MAGQGTIERDTAESPNTTNGSSKPVSVNNNSNGIVHVNEQNVYEVVIQLLSMDTTDANGLVEAGLTSEAYHWVYDLLSDQHKAELDRLTEYTDGWFYIP